MKIVAKSWLGEKGTTDLNRNTFYRGRSVLGFRERGER